MVGATLPLLQSQYLLKYFVKVLCWAYLLLVLFAPKSRSTSLNLNQLNHTKEEICGDIDIRNSVKNFDKLKNCSVIEGHLQILLIDRGVPSDYANLSFPKLREITDFLLLYRVVGLRTLRHLFPNLAVIRGSKLFHNYAFVVYEMMSLQEIGLASLTNILRGSVHIEKNPQLCYVNTIDWDLIARSGPGHFIKTNKASNQCPNDCPQNVKCPLPPERNTRLCWDSLTCQKVCSVTCSNNSCMTSPERCCNNKCLGGCNGDKPGNCFVCRNVVYHGQCLESCLPNTYEYAGRRCITEDECKNMPSQPGKNITWKLFGDDKCLPECPSGFMDDEENKHTCRECKGPCPKVCVGIPVDSVAAAQELRGCTRINGHLDIQISGGRNVIHELEENLGKIEEVDDYVKIVRSFPLVSLNFLKNLRKIHGKRKENENYSLLVFDNHNLQEIMDFKNRTIPLEIVSGKMFFHNNPKLCPSKIEELRNYTGLPKWDDRDVSPNSNGDRVACNIRPLRVWVKPEKIQSTMAAVYWENFLRNLSDHRSLLAYVVSYKEAPYRNVTLFDGRDACGTDSWKVHDVSASSDKEESEMDILDYLKPFTQYAVFVRTYTVGNEKNGAQSPIVYFTTLPDTPSSPLDLKATSPNPSQLKITWLPPIKPNGNVTHYVVTGYYKKDEQSFLDRRNYCLEPLIVPDRKKVEHLEKDWSYSSDNKTEFPRIKPTNLPENCCQCPKEKKLEEEKDELEFQIIFEDTLHNHVYIKRPLGDTSSVPAEEEHQKRRRRSINSNFSERPNNISKATITPRPLQPLTTMLTVATSTAVADAVSPPAFNVTVNMTAGVVVFNLTHFSEYTIEVIACHEPNPHNYERCSKKSMTTARTAALDGSDNINSSTIQTRVLNGTTGKVRIQWEEPPHPNGLIVSYHIEFKRTMVENYKPTTVCITHKHYREKKSYMLSELGPGNYSLKLRATSLAGDGEWTSPVYFVILEPSGGLSAEVVAAITAICIIAFIFLIAGAVVYVFKQKLALTVPGSVLYASVNPEYISAAKAYVPDEWEVPRKKISTTKELGRGSFGTVFEGTAKKLKKGQLITKVAVKTTNPNASADEMFAFLQEASVMKAFNCHHVVRLLGVVSKTAPPLVIMELMSHGDLKTFLRMHNPESCGVCNPDVDKPESRSLVPSRKMSGKKKKKKEIVDDTPPTLKRLYQMAVEIADGMAYLSAKKFVHRDLAARNCLVAEDMTVKIGDFGLTRDIYETDYYRKDGKGMLPIRWMAPEAVRDGVFTSQSDVWSYGIVLWEMVTRAAQPYTTMKNSDVHRFISDGGIMGRPSGCPEKMYHLMSRCWNKLPQRRPTFRMLTSELLSYANEKFHKVAFYYTSEAERLAYSEIDIEDTMPSTHLKLYLWNDQDMPPEVDDECWGDEEDVNNSLIVPNDEDSASDDNTADKRMRTKVIHPAVQCINFDEEERNFSTHSSDSSKGLSLQSSEGSKVSGRSVNGGLANGHMHFPVAKSTQC